MYQIQKNQIRKYMYDRMQLHGYIDDAVIFGRFSGFVVVFLGAVWVRLIQRFRYFVVLSLYHVIPLFAYLQELSVFGMNSQKSVKCRFLCLFGLLFTLILRSENRLILHVSMIVCAWTSDRSLTCTSRGTPPEQAGAPPPISYISHIYTKREKQFL